MLSLQQEPGVKISGVTESDKDDIQAFLDAARGRFDVNQQIKTMLERAHSTNTDLVYLEREGWHQTETLYGCKWKHITILAGGTFHCYAVVSSALDHPMSATHEITSITCRGGRVEVRI
ncbi:hypothetical protein G5B39_10100 [Rhodobacteraceae bacterium SC52]|nr:hypothetical protein G5B39_10100 [Rhodobacteraceae bacterium SC52]